MFSSLPRYIHSMVQPQRICRFHQGQRAKKGALQKAAAKTWKGVAAQVAAQNLTVANERLIKGQFQYELQRLHVREITIWLMVSGFVIVCALTILVLLTRPIGVVSRRPDSIGALATILASSKELNRLLTGLGRSPTRDIRERLSCYEFRSHVRGSTFSIEPSSPKTENVRLITKSVPEHWYRPFVIRKAAITVILLFPILLISILESIQRISDRENGFVDIPAGFFATTAYASYLPAFVVVLVATLFSTLDFNVLMFSPFSALRAENSPARKGIQSHLLGSNPLVTLFQAARANRWGAVLSTSAALAGSVLTIIVSGLYVVDNIPCYDLLGSRATLVHYIGAPHPIS
jgi:hypothetical protein